MKKICKIAVFFGWMTAAVGLTAQGFYPTAARSTQEPSDRVVFERTMKELDQGGLVLTFMNARESVQFGKEFVELILRAAGEDFSSDETKSMKAIGEDILDQSGISAIQSIGASVSRNNGVYLYKSFLSAPGPRSGLIWDLVPENKPLAELCRFVPRHAFFAMGGTVRLKPAYDRVMKLLEKHLPADDMAQITETLDSLKEEGIDLPHQLSAWTGYTVWLENRPDKNPIVPGLTGGAAVLEMADDSLFQLLLLKMEPEQVKDGIVMIPDTPLLMTQKGKYLIVATDAEIFENVQKKQIVSLSSDPDFLRYAAGLPDSANGFVWWGARGKDTLESLIQAFCPEDQRAFVKELAAIAGFDKPVLSVSAAKPEGLLVAIRAATGSLLCPMASASAFWSSGILPFSAAAGCILPAVGAARETGKQANCTNNLKQISVALLMYENDNNTFPKKRGFAGLNELRAGGYLTDAPCFVCPSSSLSPAEEDEALSAGNCSYLYFAGLTSASDPNLPIVMDIPGNHKNGLVKYARIDGAVQTVKIGTDSSAENAVYAILGKKSGFTEDEQKIVKQAKDWDAGRRK